MPFLGESCHQSITLSILILGVQLKNVLALILLHQMLSKACSGMRNTTNRGLVQQINHGVEFPRFGAKRQGRLVARISF